RSARALGARALSRRAPRSGQRPRRDRRVRHAVALGRAAAVDGPRDGRRPARRRDDGGRHSRSRQRRRDGPPGAAGAERAAWPRAGLACRVAAGARAARTRRARVRAPAVRRGPVRRIDRGSVRSPARAGGGVRLGIVYHMPFWQAADGALWEIEGSFARYVDSLAPHVDEISLCVPVLPGDAPGREGTRVRARNVRLAPLPYFEGPRQFYPRLGAMRRTLRGWVRTVDLINCRVPTPAAWFAFKEARRAGVPVYLLVVGDLEALRPTLPYRGVKRLAYAAYVAYEERAIRTMSGQSLTLSYRRALADKPRRQGPDVIETKTTPISAADIQTRADTCARAAIRLLTVSRIDPRKQLRCLPGAIAELRAGGRDVQLDLVGPAVGATG